MQPPGPQLASMKEMQQKVEFHQKNPNMKNLSGPPY